jgi:hypothetical protein
MGRDSLNVRQQQPPAEAQTEQQSLQGQLCHWQMKLDTSHWILVQRKRRLLQLQVRFGLFGLAVVVPRRCQFELRALEFWRVMRASR